MTFAERSSAVAAPRDAPLRILVVAIGLAVLTIGVALSVFPGLAVLVVSRGLTILSPDLRWAGKLHRPMQKLHDLRKTRNSDRLLPSN